MARATNLNMIIEDESSRDPTFKEGEDDVPDFGGLNRLASADEQIETRQYNLPGVSQDISKS